MAPKKLGNFYDPITGAKLLTVEEAADYLHYHPGSIRRLVCVKALQPYSRAGKSLLFMADDLDRFRISHAWAARKSTIEKSEIISGPAPTQLTAEVKVDLGPGAMFTHLFETISHFTWAQIPLIKAKVNEKHKSIPFEIIVKGPDSGTWTIRYDPPTWIEKVIKRFGKKQPKE